MSLVVRHDAIGWALCYRQLTMCWCRGCSREYAPGKGLFFLAIADMGLSITKGQASVRSCNCWSAIWPQQLSYGIAAECNHFDWRVIHQLITGTSNAAANIHPDKHRLSISTLNIIHIRTVPYTTLQPRPMTYTLIPTAHHTEHTHKRAPLVYTRASLTGAKNFQNLFQCHSQILNHTTRLSFLVSAERSARGRHGRRAKV